MNLNRIKAARAGATARTATGKNIPFTVYTREGGASSAGRGPATHGAPK